MVTQWPVLSLVTGRVERAASFQRLVDSIIAHTGDIPWELVVADASEVPYASTLPNIRVLHESPRRTCVQGYNAAFWAACGKYVLYLNDDAEVCPGYALAAVNFMESHPRIGLGALHYSQDGGEFHVNEAYGCMYANFGILPKELGESIGFFDEALRMYGCDNSLTFRVLLANYGVADIQTAKVIHHCVRDEYRVENQRYRMADNHMMTETYMHLRPQWLATYRRYRVETGTVPWVHGTNPNNTVQR